MQTKIYQFIFYHNMYSQQTRCLYNRSNTTIITKSQLILLLNPMSKASKISWSIGPSVLWAPHAARVCSITTVWRLGIHATTDKKLINSDLIEIWWPTPKPKLQKSIINPSIDRSVSQCGLYCHKCILVMIFIGRINEWLTDVKVSYDYDYYW